MRLAKQDGTIAYFCSQLTPRTRSPKRGHCVRIPAEIVHDPDPAIYDQELEYTSGRTPTFNSPDVTTVSLWPIKPWNKISVCLRNLSADASANGTRVDIRWSPWGIGMPREAIASMFVDLARAGSPGSERTTAITTPAEVLEAERYGIFVEISHPYDRDPTNNRSEQTIDGFQTSQKRHGQFIIPVRNPTASTAVIQLSVVPDLWSATIVPASVTLSPGAQQDVQFSVDVPAGIPPAPSGTCISETFEVIATTSGILLGGVAILVLVD